MSKAYQGHLPGSGVQRHSAGEAYPYIVCVVEVCETHRRYEVIGPGVDRPIAFTSGSQADRAARQLKAWSESADAWAFAYEGVTHSCFGGVRLQKVIDAGRAYSRATMGGLVMFDEMRPDQRVAVLLYMGAEANTLVRVGTGGDASFFAARQSMSY